MVSTECGDKYGEISGDNLFMVGRSSTDLELYRRVMDSWLHKLPHVRPLVIPFKHKNEGARQSQLQTFTPYPHSLL